MIYEPEICSIYILTQCKQREFLDPENSELSSDDAIVILITLRVFVHIALLV